jgi:hypothetical protein
VKTHRIIKAPESQMITAIRKSRVAIVKKRICRKNWFNLRVSAFALKEDTGNKKSKKSASHSRDEKYIINGKIRIPQMVSKIGILRRYQIQ